MKIICFVTLVTLMMPVSSMAFDLGSVLDVVQQSGVLKDAKATDLLEKPAEQTNTPSQNGQRRTSRTRASSGAIARPQAPTPPSVSGYKGSTAIEMNQSSPTISRDTNGRNTAYEGAGSTSELSRRRSAARTR